MQGGREALHGEKIAPNIPNPELVPLEDTADRLGSSIELFSDLFDGPLDQFFSQCLDFVVSPASVIHLFLEPLLDNELPASLFGATAVTLQSNDQWFELMS
ncbi:hypothetical protein GRAN_5236 [Granulicella sibirica]|uniref:Uncharacterized protein n=1 Tax=Granulicella sibirica TaxID=2479048 RepID=A0A4Q0SWF8_9BACT|nr:hypothetical protein GRAN_5236 [Granulicella sibirica]